tara:strand:+ start:191 stop:460 length:270 start_codon:yes stop_codon:yes gene_type:complete
MQSDLVRRQPVLQQFLLTLARDWLVFPPFSQTMARDIIILECTEAKAEGKQPSRYVTTRNKKSLRTPGRLEKVKFNHYLKRRTLHRELR